MRLVDEYPEFNVVQLPAVRANSGFVVPAVASHWRRLRALVCDLQCDATVANRTAVLALARQGTSENLYVTTPMQAATTLIAITASQHRLFSIAGPSKAYATNDSLDEIIEWPVGDLIIPPTFIIQMTFPNGVIGDVVSQIMAIFERVS